MLFREDILIVLGIGCRKCDIFQFRVYNPSGVAVVGI